MEEYFLSSYLWDVFVCFCVYCWFGVTDKETKLGRRKKYTTKKNTMCFFSWCIFLCTALSWNF